MRERGTPRRAAAGRGGRETEGDAHLPQADVAAVPIDTAREDLIRDLAGADDWRVRVAALGLSEAEARELRVDVVRARVFAATERSAQRGARRRRA